MTARVFDVFEHAYNPLEVARQEYDLAREDYATACRNFEGRNPVAMAKLAAASGRKSRAWDYYWKMTRGY